MELERGHREAAQLQELRDILCYEKFEQITSWQSPRGNEQTLDEVNEEYLHDEKYEDKIDFSNPATLDQTKARVTEVSVWIGIARVITRV